MINNTATGSECQSGLRNLVLSPVSIWATVFLTGGRKGCLVQEVMCIRKHLYGQYTLHIKIEHVKLSVQEKLYSFWLLKYPFNRKTNKQDATFFSPKSIHIGMSREACMKLAHTCCEMFFMINSFQYTQENTLLIQICHCFEMARREKKSKQQIFCSAIRQAKDMSG